MSGPRNLLATLPYQKLFFDLTANPITTAAWVPILAAANNLKSCTAIHYFYTGSGIIKLSDGVSGSEDAGELPLYIMPGGIGSLVPLEIPRLQLLSAKAVDVDADLGVLVINFFG